MESETEKEPAPTQEKAKAISGLSADTAHKICSDRVTGRKSISGSCLIIFNHLIR